MKSRMGFVSNSSSSSFIVTGNFKDGVPTVTIDLSSFGRLIKNEDDLRDYIENECGDEYTPDHYAAAPILKALARGKSVFVGSVDNELSAIFEYLDGDYKVEVDY